jgi:hypothetical protein
MRKPTKREIANELWRRAEIEREDVARYLRHQTVDGLKKLMNEAKEEGEVSEHEFK